MNYRIGDIVTGKVTGIQPYGAFVALDDEEQGLIHISECQQGYVASLNDVFQVGQAVQVIILDIDEYTHKISLSIRALQDRPVSGRRRRKHFWTNRKAHSGFKPIADNLAGWISDFQAYDEHNH
ncbi:CvfD/Ygs/GSP13 family RNA-binding post-transcriptional regulator [Lacticaseibacillus sharpeae]|uniref:General stress protein 13 n=1 Tax=Lacticaseibacillus sharpeae JCM 1186 = DSM 20505 TaxID=1291052 RepID=A0A0R1ZJ05_9LACO|nr:CvfD/Ygs/GSP13 family RNA-binding post-transcriptional regulator [Lacticaseibacillus sharpeae]KRM54346.1 General stress protein 13 [Lacticaseibacillus sharpeae JCM 1186 = DSM 20505]